MRYIVIFVSALILGVSVYLGVFPKVIYTYLPVTQEQTAQMEVNAKLCYRDSDCVTPCEDKSSCNANYLNSYYSQKNSVSCSLSKDNCKPFTKISCLDNECVGVSAK